MFAKKSIFRAKRIAFLLVGYSFVNTLIFGDESISVREYALLSECFKSMLETSEAGYVLCGQKPLCLIGHSRYEFSFEPREFHQLSVSIGMAKEILQRPIFRSGQKMLKAISSYKKTLCMTPQADASKKWTGRLILQQPMTPLGSPSLTKTQPTISHRFLLITVAHSKKQSLIH